MLRVVLLSEYLRIVKTKAFWLVTLLMPLGVFVAGGAFAYFASQDDDSSSYRLAVFGGDEPTLAALGESLGEGFHLLPSTGSLQEGKQAVLAGSNDALLVVPGDGAAPAVQLYARELPSLLQRGRLQSATTNTLRDIRLAAFELPAQVRSVIDERVEFAVVQLTDDGEKAAGIGPAALFGCAIALALMVAVVMFGGNVMQMVMEEKASRMAEIIVSSVRPFDLMLGKILASALLAGSQLLIWSALGSLFGGIALALFVDPDGIAELTEAGQAFLASGDAEAGAATSAQLPRPIAAGVLALALLPVAFLLHASVFAALGAMFEQTTTAQNAIFVGMLPALGSIGLAVAALAQEGGSALVFGSFFPFSSPAMLPARVLAGDMPAWQVVASLALLAASTFVTVWLAGRVFRGSLLMFGKTPSLRDLRTILLES